MAVAKKKILDETSYFTLEEHSTKGRVLRRVVCCTRCHKNKAFAGMVKIIKHKCCQREYQWPQAEAAVETKD